MPPIGHYLFLSFALMMIGVIGAVTRRNSIIRLFSLELILTAASINFAAFARLFGDAVGHVFAILLTIIVCIEMLVALAIFAAVFRRLPGPASAE